MIDSKFTKEEIKGFKICEEISLTINKKVKMKYHLHENILHADNNKFFENTS